MQAIQNAAISVSLPVVVGLGVADPKALVSRVLTIAGIGGATESRSPESKADGGMYGSSTAETTKPSAWGAPAASSRMYHACRGVDLLCTTSSYMK